MLLGSYIANVVLNPVVTKLRTYMHDLSSELHARTFCLP